MITEPTVLILGAGASQHLGYPLGVDLKKHICSRHPNAQSLPNEWNVEEVGDYIERFKKANMSIDEFLELVPESAHIGKFLAAKTLKGRENLDGLFPPSNPGWYEYLFKSLLSTDREYDLSGNKLSIVTFNYDRSLEVYLIESLAARFNIPLEEAAKEISCIPIVHIYGSLGTYPEVLYQNESDPNKILELSKELVHIHDIEDNEDDFCTEGFRASHDLLKRAENIYFMGFSFHPGNLKRFMFFNSENTNNKSIFAAMGSIRTMERAELQEMFKELGISIDLIGITCDLFFRSSVRFK